MVEPTDRGEERLERLGGGHVHRETRCFVCQLGFTTRFIKVDVDANPNEVQATKWVSAKELKEMFKDDKLLFTPWFKLICQTMMFEWWENLDSGLDKYLNEGEIRRML